MNELVADLVGGSAIARSAFEERFARAWASDDRAAGHDLLDALADAARSSDAALETLIVALQANRVTHPAIRRLLIDPDDIDDVEQATLANVALKLDAFDGRSKFSTWLFTIATNEAKMLLRSRSRRPQTPEAQPDVGYVARLSTILGQRDAIDRAIVALPDELREVFVAREIDQLGYAEIAARFDLAAGTVRSRLHRARSLVATHLRDTDA